MMRTKIDRNKETSDKLDAMWNDLTEKARDVIAGESIKQPMLSRDVLRLWLKSFMDGDVTDADFRSRLVETFIDKIELKNGEAYIFFNVTGRDRQKRFAYHPPSGLKRFVGKPFHPPGLYHL